MPRILLPSPLQAGEEDVAAAVKAGQLPRSRKAAARQKVLRSAAILAAAHNATPAAKVVPRKPKGSVLAQQRRTKQAAGSKGGKAAAAGDAAAALDIWGEAAEEGDGWTAGLLPSKRQKRGPAPSVRQRQLVASAGGAIVPAAAGRERPRAAVPAVSRAGGQGGRGWAGVGRGGDLQGWGGGGAARWPQPARAAHLQPTNQAASCCPLLPLLLLFRWRLTPRAAPTTQTPSCTRRRWRRRWRRRRASCWTR